MAGTAPGGAARGRRELAARAGAAVPSAAGHAPATQQCDGHKVLPMIRDSLPLGALPSCGNCGSQSVCRRLRQSRTSASSAQLVCARCGAHSAVFVGQAAEGQVKEDLRRRPACVTVHGLAGEVRTSARPHALSASKSEERDPLELIARMVVGTSYRVLSEGHSTAGTLRPADVAGAVAMMRDPVAKQIAMAVVLRSEGNALAIVGRSAARRVFRAFRGLGCAAPLHVDDPADRWRLRLVMNDAVNDMVWPERKAPVQAAAKAAKMRKSTYLRAYTLVEGVLGSALEGARQEFSIRLFS